jgi:transcriptional regulator with XRE-family HTH domain
MRILNAIAPETDLAPVFGERLFRTRVAAGLTQRQLGRRCGMSHVAISKYETGRCLPAFGALVRLVIALETSGDWLLMGWSK